MKSKAPRIELQKLIKAPRGRVFDAWTRPELMVLWMAPGNSKVTESQVDLKVGGAYRIKMNGEMNGHSFDVAVGGTYQDIVPDQRLSFTWIYEDEERKNTVGDSLVTVLLDTVPEGTRLTLIHERIATKEKREGHTWGWINCLEKLEALVSRT